MLVVEVDCDVGAILLPVVGTFVVREVGAVVGEKLLAVVGTFVVKEVGAVVGSVDALVTELVVTVPLLFDVT